MLNINSFSVDLIIFAIIVGGGFFVRFWRRWSLNRLSDRSVPLADSQDNSEIIAYYSAGQTLASAGRGELNGMRFTSYISTPITPDAASAAEGVAAGFSRYGNRSGTPADQPLSYVNEVAAIFVLDLPFSTGTHLLGLSKEHKIDRLQFENFLKANGLVKVVLEGDFGDYFDIYAAEGQDLQVREVLNPKSMAFVVDYCRTHFWEINAAELYIVASEQDKGSDNLIKDSQQFVEQIKPALLPGDPGAAPVHHETPYGEYDGPPLPCPICQKPMTITDNWMACPDGHGVLMDGKDLARLHGGDLHIAADAARSIKHDTITCPNCHNQMETVNYEETANEIATCTNCPYRWLDADDVVHLQPKSESSES